MSESPKLNLGNAPDDPAKINRLVADAVVAYAMRQTEKAATTLSAAETAARKANLHREAAKIRKALTILAQGGKPRLLTRPGYFENEK